MGSEVAVEMTTRSKAHRKKTKKHGTILIAAILTASIGLALAIYYAPGNMSAGLHALTNGGIEIRPTRHGLAEIKMPSSEDVSSESDSKGLGEASQAGDRIQNQLILDEAAGNQ